MMTVDFINPEFFSYDSTPSVLRGIEGNPVIHILDASPWFLDSHERQHDGGIDTKIFMDFLSALRGVLAYLFLLEQWGFRLYIPNGCHGFTADKSDLLAFTVVLPDIHFVDMPFL